MLTVDEIIKVLASGEKLASSRIIGRPNVSDADKEAAKRHIRLSKSLRLALYEMKDHPEYKKYVTMLRELQQEDSTPTEE